MAFAKLYEKEDLGQLLIKLDSGDEGPEVRFFFEPKGLGVCTVALSWAKLEEDKAWDKAEEVFDKMADEEAAWRIVEKPMKEMGSLFEC
jgi:hypothetical protein